MYLLAGITGLGVAVLIWIAFSRWIARAIVWVETRSPELAGSRAVRAGEAAACGLLFVVSLAAAFWVTRVLWLQWR